MISTMESTTSYEAFTATDKQFTKPLGRDGNAMKGDQSCTCISGDNTSGESMLIYRLRDYQRVSQFGPLCFGV